MRGYFRVVAMFFLISLSTLPTLTMAASVNCEANLIETNKAIENALQNRANEKRIAAAAAAGGACALFSVFLLGLDFGSTAAACIGVSALTYGTLTYEEQKSISKKVYDEFRDKRCIKKKY